MREFPHYYRVSAEAETQGDIEVGNSLKGAVHLVTDIDVATDLVGDLPKA